MIQSVKYLLLISGFFFSSFVMAEDSARWLSPETVDGTETVSLEQAKQLHSKGTTFIDVRSERQYRKRHIPGAVNLYIKDKFTQQNLLKQISKDEPFVIYCNGRHCSLSYKASEKAVDWGFTQIKYFRDGARAWRLDGNPLEYPAN